MSQDSKNRFPDEPEIRWTTKDFEQFVIWAASNKGASDIKIAPRSPFWIRVDGAWVSASKRRITHDEISHILNNIARSNDATDRTISSPGFPFEYEVVCSGQEAGDINFDPKAAAAKRYRFRAEATGCRDGLGSSIELTLRSLPDVPPTVHQLDTPKEIIDNCTPTNGLILITGTMGSGKTTSLAAILRYINENLPWSIATYEQPIEFDLNAIPEPVGPLVQSQIPDQFSSFKLAARNSTRRAQDVILIGESRDSETVGSMLEAAEIGSVVFTTLHARSVPETPDRLISIFPEKEQAAVAGRFASAIRLIVYQRLVPRINPESGEQLGRIPLIEYLPVDAEMNMKLSRSPASEFKEIMLNAIKSGKGRSLSAHAQQLYDQGLISQRDFEAATREAKDLEK